MRVELAYPFDGHAPDETIEVDKRVGRNLISAGRARPVADEGAPPASKSKRPAAKRANTTAPPIPPAPSADPEEADE